MFFRHSLSLIVVLSLLGISTAHTVEKTTNIVEKSAFLQRDEVEAISKLIDEQMKLREPPRALC